MMSNREKWRYFFELPKWERFKHFFQLVIFRYLVLWFSVVPVIATLVHGIPKPLPVNIAGQIYNIELGLPFNWQILWLASFFYFLAFLVYFVMCPKFIKQYNQYSEYKAYGHDQRWLAWEARLLMGNDASIKKFTERLLRKNFLEQLDDDHDIGAVENPRVGATQTKYVFEHSGKKYLLAMPVIKDDEIVEGSERGVFWEVFGCFSRSRNFSRGLILFLLVISGCLFMAVLSEHVWSGAQYVINWAINLLTSK